MFWWCVVVVCLLCLLSNHAHLLLWWVVGSCCRIYGIFLWPDCCKYQASAVKLKCPFLAWCAVSTCKVWVACWRGWKWAQAGLDFGPMNEESPWRDGFICLLLRAATTIGSGKNSEDAEKKWALLTSHDPHERERAQKSERGQKCDQRAQIVVGNTKGCTKFYMFGCKILGLYLNIYHFLKGSSYAPVMSVIPCIKWGSGLNALRG